MANQNVTIGRIVRFVDSNGQEWPAIVTVVHGLPGTASLIPTVSLQVFRQADVIPATSVPYLAPETATDEGKGRGFTWHWPERG